MLLSDLLNELRPSGIGIVGEWSIDDRKGIMLGDPKKYFPHPTGPQVPVDTTKGDNPNLPSEQIKAIRRAFRVGEYSA